MKKLLILAVAAAVGVGACKKTDGTVSTLHNYSTPTLIVSSGDYYSIPVGGPLPEITATAYDSFYNETATVVYDQSKLDNTTPGVYPVIASARNKYGMMSKRTLYVAVTDVTGYNLAGTYRRAETSDTVSVTRLANSFYAITDLVANGASDAMHAVPGHFVQTSATELIIPMQDSKYGPVHGTEGVVLMAPGDTTISFRLHNNAVSPVLRTFTKI